MDTFGISVATTAEKAMNAFFDWGAESAAGLAFIAAIALLIALMLTGKGSLSKGSVGAEAPDYNPQSHDYYGEYMESMKNAKKKRQEWLSPQDREMYMKINQTDK